MSAQEATDSLWSCKCPNVILSKQINLQSASVHGFSLKMRKSSLHMQDTTQCIKKRHGAVFSDKLRQLEKNWCLWNITESFCLPGRTKFVWERDLNIKFEKNIWHRGTGFQNKIRLFAVFKELQTLLYQNILRQANSYQKILTWTLSSSPFNYLIS